MTGTKTRPGITTTTRFGVKFAGAVDRVTHVNPCANEEHAQRFCAALQFCGNRDACVVVNDGRGWRPVDTPDATAAIRYENRLHAVADYVMAACEWLIGTARKAVTR